MKAITVSFYIFINLVFLGMFGYGYLLWSQYWSYLTRKLPYSSTKSIYDKQIYYYNHGYPNETGLSTNHNNDRFTKRNPRQIRTKTVNETVVIVKDSKPRFPNLQSSVLQLDTNTYRCGNNNSYNCSEITNIYKNKVLMELERFLMKEGDIFKSGNKESNPYNVKYNGLRGNYKHKTRSEILCQLKKSVEIKTIRRNDYPFKNLDFGRYIPRKDLFTNKHFNSCAIIASAGSLNNSNSGKFIDGHDLILRFNHAPTSGFEQDVGSKTTIRIINSQVITKEEFHFQSSRLYRGVAMLAWDPSRYDASLDEWYREPEYKDVFKQYQEYRRKYTRSKLYLINPNSLWSVWKFLQSNIPYRLRKNPPSSGFLAIAYLVQRCSYVDVFEYVPSVRASSSCHYFGPQRDDATGTCTLGTWHPLAAEKLIAFSINQADDFTVFQRGYIRIPGIKELNC